MNRGLNAVMRNYVITEKKKGNVAGGQEIEDVTKLVRLARWLKRTSPLRSQLASGQRND